MGDPVGHDGEHIWLRQSITQTTPGQTRTIEIGISVRPGMTADQIEALLREADAGMQRLSHHLDSQMAGQNGRGAGMEATGAETRPVEARSVEARSVESRPSEPRSADARPAPPRPPVRAPSPPPTPPNVREEEPEDSREALSLKDFIAAVQTEMNLNPKQAMEKLNVRSLAGLNLREALETLRRQALGAASATSAAPGSGSGRSSPSAPPRYFEEEDEGEFDVTLTLDDEEDEDEDSDDGEDSVDGDEPGEPDELEDVPDFDTAPPPPARAKITPIAGDRARATQIIGQLRQAAGGGAPTSHQRAAYRNIIRHELGEQSARALVQGLWRVEADKLSAEQLDALLSWGKRETFGEEADLVLQALRAEREQKPAAGGDAEARPPRRTAPPRGGS